MLSENVFRPSDIPSTPVRLQDVIACARSLRRTGWPETTCDVFEVWHMQQSLISSMKDNEELRKSWVCMKIALVIPEDESA